MSNQPTSRPEPEALHRSMLQASLQVAALDRKVEGERRRDGLAPFLEVWRDASAGLRAALWRARADLERHGTAREHLESIERRLEDLQRRLAGFDVGADLDECAGSWGHLAQEIAALSGPRRQELLRFLADRKDAIDRATAGLSKARTAGGVHPDQRARLRAAEEERERLRELYARLRDDYLRAARGHATAHPSGAVAPIVVTLPELLAPQRLLRPASPRLDAVIERDRRTRIGVVQRFEKTLGSLATADHRTLTDPRAGELRGHLARMDGILARLKERRSASELSDGAREVGGLLAQMGDLAAGGSAAALQPFRALLEERRAALASLAGEAQKAAGAKALLQRGALPQPSAVALGEKQLQTLRKLHPGIERLLRDASANQLAGELRRPEAHSLLERAQGLGSQGLAGLRHAIAGAHLDGFGAAHRGGLVALGEHGAIGRALAGQPAGDRAHAQARELHELLGTLKKAPRGSPLHEIAIHAEDRRRQSAERAKARLHGRVSAHDAARALGEAFHAHGRSDFAAHVAPGGPLYHLLQAVQRSHGLPVPQLASHFLQSRGAQPLAGTMQLFDRLRGEGHRPHFGLLSRLKNAAGDAFHKATSAVAHTAADAARTAGALAKASGGAVRSGISDLGHQAYDAGQRVSAAVHAAAGSVGRGVSQAGCAMVSGARRLSGALEEGAHWAGDKAAGLARAARRAASRVTHTVSDLAQAGFHRATELGAAVLHGTGDAARRAYGFARGAVYTGLDALHRTGVAGGIGKGLRFGVSMLKAAARYSPVALAMQGFRKAGGLQGIWEKTKHTAGAAWQGVQKAYHATAGFLQSPAGQLLVTGLSLAATFIPGGVVVKSIVGGVIGGIQAISEGKDFKHVLLAAGTGALTGALPFLKLGPLAGIGIGALTGAASALASGSSLKDALKGAAGGALDWFDPGALKALGRLKGFKAARKILQGEQLSKLEKLAVEGRDLKRPLSGLEKLMRKKSMRRAVGGLEKLYSKGVKGGILVSGKAARAQGYLDKAVTMGDRLEGGLSLIHQLAPDVVDALGDNALGRLIAQAGDYAGAGDESLKKALEMGHGASGALQRYRGYLDKGLVHAGVQDPIKAYGRMMARKDARAGKPEGIEAVARDKLARHRLRHPELHEAAALARQGAGVFGEDNELGAYLLHLADRRGGAAEHAESAEHGLAKLQGLQKNAVRMGRKLDGKLGKVEGKLRRGIAAGHRVEHGLEEVSRIAGALGDLFGDESAIGHLADQVHDSADKGHDKLHDALQLAGRGKKGLHQGRQLLEEALHLGAQRHVEKSHREHAHEAGQGRPHEPHREHVRELADAAVDVARPQPHADPHAAVQAAALAVSHFGSAVDGAIKAVRRLLERDRGAEAAERIRSVQELGEQAAAAVRGAERAAANDPALAGRAAKLRDHLQEIRAHFRQLVSGLKGLDSKAAAALDGEQGGRRDDHPRHAPGGRRGGRPQGDLVDEVLRGIDDGRIFVDRSAHRGERPDRDHQEVDSAAIDTWIGSGEGVKLFSDVFGPFLPVEEAGRRGGGHRRRSGHGSRGGRGHRGHAPHDQRARPEAARGKGGFFAKVFEKVEDFAEGVAHVAHAGAGLLGKAMHYAEMGMHGLNVVEHAAGRVHDLAGKAEGFLYRVHLGSAAGFAHQVGAAAGWVDARAEEAHGGLETADEALGEGKHGLETVESYGHRSAKIAQKARKGRFGDLLHLFRAAADGDGIDGKLRPELVRLGSSLDEPRRLDALTQARMEQFLGGDFTGVRLHVGPGAAQITSRYAAEAVTVKDHVFFAPGKFNPDSVEGQKLLAHELTHVLQKGRRNLDVRTAETEALHAEHSYGAAPAMEPLNLSRPAPDFRLPDGEGAPASDGIHTAKRTRSRGHDAGGRDELLDGEELLEKVSGRVYELLMDELEQSFESR